ncbi:MAG: protein thiol/disulfide oxidoreductase DsbE [Rhizobiaceae bacterium]|nr:protein thiol/disulfide oxidoreductase DsbE [Rhizobiaceae bacterium]
MAAETQSPPRPRRLLVFLPLLVFGGLAAIFLMRLGSGRDMSAIPSALIGQPAPATSLPAMPGLDLPGLESRHFAGQVTLVNVWASWCAPCRQEHPLLMELAEDRRFAVSGLNYKDQPENARRFLGSLGNPFGAIGVDQAGRAAIDWGVYGVPETFLVGKKGEILYKHVGPLTPQAVAADLMAEIEAALTASP